MQNVEFEPNTSLKRAFWRAFLPLEMLKKINGFGDNHANNSCGNHASRSKLPSNKEKLSISPPKFANLEKQKDNNESTRTNQFGSLTVL